MSIATSLATWRCSRKSASKPRQRYRRHQAGHLHVSLGRLQKHSNVSSDILANMNLKEKPRKSLLTCFATSLFHGSTSDFPGCRSDAPSDSTSPLNRMKFLPCGTARHSAIFMSSTWRPVGTVFILPKSPKIVCVTGMSILFL